MPVALERALKRKVAGKKMSKERKDAYVYGTLRKTGWKPKRELSSMLDSIIRFEQGGWNVRRVADLVSPGGRVTGTEYKSEKSPGVGAALKRNLGKIALPASGAVIGGTLGHLGWGRARLPATKLKLSGIFEEGPGLTIPSIQDAGRSASLMPATLGAAAGAGLFAPSGIQADRIRKHQSIMNQVVPMATEDYLRARGIQKRPVNMSWKTQRLIQLSAKLDEIHASTHPTQ